MGIKGKPVAAVDMGSTATRVLIGALEGETMRLIGYGESDAAAAWNRSRVNDGQALGESLRRALALAEREAKVSVESVVIGIGGSVQGFNSRGLYEFGRRREVEAADLRYAVQLGSRVRLEQDRLLLQVCPQDFTLDGRSGYRNPKNVACSRIEANVHIVTASAQDHGALVAALHQAHLAVDESIFEGISAAYACVLPEDRARGVAVIDIGAQSTHLAIYDGEALLLVATIPIAGDHITRDVSWLLKVNYEDAECLKREYGSALAGTESDHSLIEIPSGEGRAPREAPRSELNQYIEARATDIFEHVYAEILRAGMERNLLEGAVLTGGGALLPGMCDLAERVLQCQARNGFSVGIEDWPHPLDSPSWAVAGGLLMYAGRLRLKRDVQRASHGLTNLVLK